MDFLPPDLDLPPDTLALPNTADVRTQADAVAASAAVALHFPAWTDGRAYSQAVLLRGRLRFAGRLIAHGEVLADMLPLLQRCGFDAVRLRADQSRRTAERALGLSPAHLGAGAAYQTVLAERRAARDGAGEPHAAGVGEDAWADGGAPARAAAAAAARSRVDATAPLAAAAAGRSVVGSGTAGAASPTSRLPVDGARP